MSSPPPRSNSDANAKAAPGGSTNRAEQDAPPSQGADVTGGPGGAGVHSDTDVQEHAKAVGGGMASGGTETQAGQVGDGSGLTGASGNSTLNTGRPTGPDSRRGTGAAATTASPAGSPENAGSPAAPASPSSMDAGHLRNDTGTGQTSARGRSPNVTEGRSVPQSGNLSGEDPDHDVTENGPSPTMSGGIKKGTNATKK